MQTKLFLAGLLVAKSFAADGAASVVGAGYGPVAPVAVATVADDTVTEITVIPVSKSAVVVPCTKCVAWPVIAIDKFLCPCCPVVGLITAIVAGAGDVVSRLGVVSAKANLRGGAGSFRPDIDQIGLPAVLALPGERVVSGENEKARIAAVMNTPMPFVLWAINKRGIMDFLPHTANQIRRIGILVYANSSYSTRNIRRFVHKIEFLIDSKSFC